jgi:transposase
LPGAARERIEVSLAMIEALDRQLAPIEQQSRQLARRQPGCRALMRHYGIGELTAPTILCELGDVSLGPSAEHPDKPRHPRNQRRQPRAPPPLAPTT